MVDFVLPHPTLPKIAYVWKEAILAQLDAMSCELPGGLRNVEITVSRYIPYPTKDLNSGSFEYEAVHFPTGQ